LIGFNQQVSTPIFDEVGPLSVTTTELFDDFVHGPRVFPFTGSLYSINHLIQVLSPLPLEKTTILAVRPVILAIFIMPFQNSKKFI
jgi:hypothetical protein